MKFLTAIFILCGIEANSQTYFPINPTIYGSNNLRLKATKTLNVPEKDTFLTNTSDTTAQVFYYKRDSSLYVWSLAKGFSKVGGDFQPLENQRLSTTNNVSFGKITGKGQGIIPLPIGSAGNTAFSDASLSAHITFADYSATPKRYPGISWWIDGVDAATDYYIPVQESISLNKFKRGILGIQGTHEFYAFESTPLSTFPNDAGFTSGSGTTGTIPKFTSSNTIGNSALVEGSTSITSSKGLTISGSNSITVNNVIISSSGGGSISTVGFKMLGSGTSTKFLNLNAPANITVADVDATFPNTDGTLVNKVNGVSPDATGNVVVPAEKYVSYSVNTDVNVDNSNGTWQLFVLIGNTTVNFNTPLFPTDGMLIELTKPGGTNMPLSENFYFPDGSFISNLTTYARLRVVYVTSETKWFILSTN